MGAVRTVALWRWKKDEPGNGGKPEDPSAPDAASSGKDFHPEPEKARKWFDAAQAVAASQNYEYALLQYASGIRLDPSVMSAHEAMYEAAVQHLNRGGKPATGRDVRQIEGPHPVHKFAAAEFAWFKDVHDPKLAIRFLDTAVKAGQLEVGHWAAPIVLNVLNRQKKPSKSLFVQAKDLFVKVMAFDQAIRASETAQRIDPSDTSLAAEMKDLIAQRAMDVAGYAEAGREGGFRGMVRDTERQRELAEAGTMAASTSVEERNLQRARTEYEKSPAVPDVINRYAQLLRRRGSPEDETEAREVYLRGYRETGEYRFRMAAGDLDIEQARRAAEARRGELEQRPGDDDARARLDQALKAWQDLMVTEYAERVTKYPTDRRVKMQLAEAQFELGQFSEAMPQFQAAKEEPRLRIKAGYMLGRCFAAEGWHSEAISEYKEALEKMDPGERELELPIRYDLMESLIAQAREEKSEALAREALSICSDIARKDIAFRDIRARRKEIDQLVKQLTAPPAAP